jgi:lipid-binding SYLF domain-containing protein
MTLDALIRSAEPFGRRSISGDEKMFGKLTSGTLMVVFMILLWVPSAGVAAAASRGEIEAGVNATLSRFYRNVPAARELGANAAGILVFPNVIKAGFGIGGEYGEGALRIEGRTVGYYNTVSASIGFQLGAQARAVIIMFMSDRALGRFRRSHNWKAGVDGSITLVTVNAGGHIDTKTIRRPIIGFIYGAKGLMYNLTLEGSKISRIRR